MVPITRSAYGFCLGDLAAMRTSLIPRPLSGRGRHRWRHGRATDTGVPSFLERLHDLLRRPGCGRRVGDREVHDTTAKVKQHHEDEEDAERCGWDDEEVDGDEVGDMIGEERLPRLRGWPPPPRHEPGD